MRKFSRLALACSLSAALTACGGNGGGAIPTHAATPVPVQPANAKFVLFIPAVPGVSSASASRRPMDFSASTRSVTIAAGSKVLTTADVSASSSLCTAATSGGRNCTVTAVAPPGSDEFTITAYDQPNGQGNAISQGTVQATISTEPTTVNVAVTGKVVKLAISLSNAFPPVGTAATTNVVVSGLDADGNIVLGAYSSPVSLQNSDTSGVTSLSTTSVASSSTPVTLSYTGTAPFASATITASLSGVGSASATFAPSPAFLNSYTPANVPGMRFAMGPGPWNIAKGPDGNMWVAATGYSELIKVAPDGTMTYYPVPNTESQLNGIVVGSDGNLWFAESNNNAIGKMTTDGVLTEYTLPGSYAAPTCVALGADGNVWFADAANNVYGKIAPDGTVTEYPEPANAGILAIASGPDGDLYMTDLNNNAILKVSTSGQLLASYTIPTAKAQPYGLAAGPDGNIWFAEFGVGKIGRVTPSGTFAEFSLPSGSPGPIAITAGPDGRVWFAEMGQEAGFGKIGYITTDGSQVRDYFGDGYHIHDLAFDSKGTLWFVADQLPRGNQEIGTFGI